MWIWIWFGLIVAVAALVTANTIGWPRVPARTSAAVRDGAVTICIPVRNEEAHMAACLESALAQGSVIREVRVCDDHSTDRTGQILAEWAARDSRVVIQHAPALPPGWTGKTHACQRLAEKVGTEWMLFLDCDTRLMPGAVDRLLAEAGRRRLTFLAPWPGLVLESAAEKTFMPLLNFSVFSLFPAMLSLLDMRVSLGLAHGACLFMRREEYFAAGGHAAVRHELFEDTALARAWRTAGFRGACLDGQDIARVRMYDRLGAIWTGFQKIIYPAFRHEFTFWLFLLFHAALFVAPLALLGGRPRAAGVMLGMAIFARLLQALRFRYPLWSALLHAPAELGLILCALVSRARVASGHGLHWRGRTYHGRA